MKTKLLLTFCAIILNFELEILNYFTQNTRLWATYYGEMTNDFGNNVITDAIGNVYLVGNTQSASGIAFGGFQNNNGGGVDAFLVKFDANGNRLWATYYGGSGDEEGNSIAADAAGNIYLAGTTNSTNTGNCIASGGFQNAKSIGSDAFLVKFDTNGNRLWGTYYDGTGGGSGNSVATDAIGNVYLAGRTNSPNTGNCIASNGFQNANGGGFSDAFLVKFDAAGNRLWGTYYGGLGWEYGDGVATDATGNVYLAGRTDSPNAGNCIASGGFQNVYGGNSFNDAYLVKFDANGNRLWGTYYGGTDLDEGYDVEADISGNVYLSGMTKSTGMAAGGFQNALAGIANAFLVKFGVSGNRLWATYYGGTGGGEELGNIATDVAGNVYLAGDTYSPDNIASGGFQNSIKGTLGTPENEYVVKFDSTGVRICATYYGDANTDHDENGHVAVDRFGKVYLSGVTPNTSIASGGFQNAHGGGYYDAYLVKFTTCTTPLVPSVASTNINCNGLCTGTGTITATGGTSPYTYLWSSGQTTQSATGLCEGTYTVTITDLFFTTTTATVTITQPAVLSATIAVTGAACNGGVGTATVNITGGTFPYTTIWSSGQTTQNVTGLTVGTYTVIITDNNGCNTISNVFVLQSATLSVTAIINDPICNGGIGSATVSINGGTFPYTYEWSNGVLQSSATNLLAGNYTLTVTDDNGCSETATVSVTQPLLLTVTLTTTEVSCNGGNNGIVTATVSGGTNPYNYQWGDGSVGSQLSNLQAGSHTVTITDNNGCTKVMTTTISQPALLTVSVSAISGCGINNPSANAGAAGGNVPYNYNWSNGGIVPAISGLISGVYTVTVTDVNNCITTSTITIFPSSIVTAIISANTTIIPGDSIVLSAAGGNSYLWAPSTSLSCSDCANPTATPQSTTEYCVIVSDANSCTDSACVTVTVDIICGELYIPTAFSPNFDNSNDEFCLHGANCIKSMTLKIYSRWGELVFETTDPTGCWDGILKVEEMEEAVFMYHLTATFMNDDGVINQKGNITLVK